MFIKRKMELKEMTTVNFEDIKLADEERQPCEVWTRVMGYLRPYSEFNVGKKSEFKSRLNFSELKAVEGCDCHCEEVSYAIAAE